MLAKTALVLLATFTSYTLAECDATSGSAVLRGSPDGGKTINEDKVCQGQGEGSWTFVMQTSAVDVPSLADGGIAGGYVDGTTFGILDNTCTVMATYAKPDCEIPYTIRESFLPWVLTIKEIDTADGSGYFKFDYGDGEYTINNNHCKCYDTSHDLTGSQSCKCAFPLNGDSH